MQLRQDSEEIIERDFLVSGVMKADSAMNTGFVIVSDAYLERYADELVYTYPEDYSSTGSIRMDVSFSNSFHIQEKLNKIIESHGYSTEEGDENYIASNANWAYISDGAEQDSITVGAVAGGLLLIILTGYLIIYNIFQISVIRDIRYYGLLKTIGTTGKQIKKILRRQALVLGFLGIPLGLIGGFILGKAVVPKFLELSSYTVDQVTVSMNPWIFVEAAVFTLLTVWISAGKPARMAARISPVEAVRYTEGYQDKRKSKKSTDGGKLWKMALSNLGRNKRKTILVLISLSLSVILLNSVFTITHSFDMDKYLKKFVSSDFVIGNAKYFGMDCYFGYNREDVQEEKLSESFVEEVQKLDGFQEGGRLYLTNGEVGLDKACWTPPDYIARDKDGNPGWYWGNKFIPYTMMDDNTYNASFYGMDDFFYKKIEVWKGETDLQVIKDKMKTGKYLLYAVETDDNNFVEENEVLHQPGDKVILTYGNGQKREFEILSLIKSDYYAMTNRMGHDRSLYPGGRSVDHGDRNHRSAELHEFRAHRNGDQTTGICHDGGHRDDKEATLENADAGRAVLCAGNSLCFLTAGEPVFHNRNSSARGRNLVYELSLCNLADAGDRADPSAAGHSGTGSGLPLWQKRKRGGKTAQS